MTNTETVIDGFESLGEPLCHKQALIFAISQRCTVPEQLATQLVEEAIKQGVLKIDAVGQVRRG